MKKIISNISYVKDNLLKKGFEFNSEKFLLLYNRNISLKKSVDSLRKKRNFFSKDHSKLQQISEIDLKYINDINENLYIEENNYKESFNELKDFIYNVPNLLDDSIFNFINNDINLEIRKWGENDCIYETSHFDIGYKLNKMMDFELSSKMSGSKFVVLRGALARLHRALGQFMLDLHTERYGYEEINVPYLIKDDALYGSGHFPKFIDDQFNISGSNLWLSATGEIQLSNILSNTILKESDLPIKYVCKTSCFRKEIGSYGKDTRGMFRQHQFDKVELMCFSSKEESFSALDIVTKHAESVLKLLNLPYRVILLSGSDTGFSSSKTYDIEVWIPSEKKYREVSSCSNTLDFQSRRMSIKYRDENSKKLEFVHIINASGLAIGRTFISLIENNQDSYGNIHIPKILYPYMGNIKVIRI